MLPEEFPSITIFPAVLAVPAPSTSWRIPMAFVAFISNLTKFFSLEILVFWATNPIEPSPFSEIGFLSQTKCPFIIVLFWLSFGKITPIAFFPLTSIVPSFIKAALPCPKLP